MAKKKTRSKKLARAVVLTESQRDQYLDLVCQGTDSKAAAIQIGVRHEDVQLTAEESSEFNRAWSNAILTRQRDYTDAQRAGISTLQIKTSFVLKLTEAGILDKILARVEKADPDTEKGWNDLKWVARYVLRDMWPSEVASKVETTQRKEVATPEDAMRRMKELMFEARDLLLERERAQEETQRVEDFVRAVHAEPIEIEAPGIPADDSDDDDAEGAHGADRPE